MRFRPLRFRLDALEARDVPAGPGDAPPLPPPPANAIQVDTVAELETAVANLQSGQTVVIQPGTYQLTRTLFVGKDNPVQNVTIRGATNNFNDVVIRGLGMDGPLVASLAHGISVYNAQDVTIANLSVGEVYYHGIDLQGVQGADRVNIYHCRVFNAGEQLIKSSAGGGGVDDSKIEYSLLEFTNGPSVIDHGGGTGYTGALHAHETDRWQIRHNLLRNFHTPDTVFHQFSPTILMWNGSADTVVEGNTFIDTDRAVAFGLVDKTSPNDHTGGVIRNNFVYQRPGLFSAARRAGSDGQLLVYDSPGTQVYHNTVMTNGNSRFSLEVRWANTGVAFDNNLTDAPLGQRDGGVYTAVGNYLTATPGMFVNPTTADLHLLDNATTRAAVIDRAPAKAGATADYDGDARPAGPAADVGADELPVTPPPPPPSGSNGLSATYYDTRDFTGPSFTRVDPTVNFNWGTGSPATGLGADTFSVRWTGQVRAVSSGLYTFYTVSDDGVRLWVNGKQLVNNWTNHGPTENRGTITLTAGQWYDIRMEYYENTGGAVARLLWSGPNLAKQVIPTAALRPPSAVPAAPSNLTGTPLSHSSVRLNWTDNSTTETGFKVERSLDGVTYTTIATTAANATTFTDTGLAAVTTYYYRVSATSAAGDSPPSPRVNVKTLFRDVFVTNSTELNAAVNAATPGTRVLLQPGVYAPGNFFSNIVGQPGRPIIIAGANPANKPVFQGGTEALHFSDIAYVEIRDLVVEGASANGINIDDGGTYDTPSHHVTLSGLVVRNVGTTGNQDGIKLSGLQQFVVENSTISFWGGGGSAIDMVGCHDGLIVGTSFRHTAGMTNGTGVQAKGGCTRITVRDNRFDNAGSRAVQIGGSTGLQFFRPQPPAGYEAKDVMVEGNVIVGSQAAVTFVGVDGATVRFNTIYRPERWVIRILQETTEPGFVPSRNGVFTDNIVAFRTDELSTAVNVGPNTAPETFTFARNWWYAINNPAQSTPSLPVAETNGTYGVDPQFVNAAGGDFHLQPGSPASAVGAYAPRP
jgi:hypothetical protein